MDSEKRRLIERALKIAKEVERESKFPGHIVYGTSPTLQRGVNVIRALVKELEKETVCFFLRKDHCIVSRFLRSRLANVLFCCIEE